MHKGVVSLLGRKCAAAIDKADESAMKAFGNPGPKVEVRTVQG